MKSYIESAAVPGAGLCDTCNAIACSTAEICVISTWTDDPVAPSDRGKVNVQRIATTLTRVGSAVDASRLTTHSALWKRVNHDERLSIVVQRNRQMTSAARLAGDMNRVRQLVILNPILHRPCDINFLPCLVLIDFPYRNGLGFREVSIRPPMTDLR